MDALLAGVVMVIAGVLVGWLLGEWRMGRVYQADTPKYDKAVRLLNAGWTVKSYPWGAEWFPPFSKAKYGIGLEAAYADLTRNRSLTGERAETPTKFDDYETGSWSRND